MSVKTPFFTPDEHINTCFNIPRFIALIGGLAFFIFQALETHSVYCVGNLACHEINTEYQRHSTQVACENGKRPEHV